jgi:RimJ/RimL family protein N-acetyltransferase
LLPDERSIYARTAKPADRDLDDAAPYPALCHRTGHSGRPRAGLGRRRSDALRFSGRTNDGGKSRRGDAKVFYLRRSPHRNAVLADRPTGDIIGFAGLLPCEALGTEDLEIGFVLSQNVWGRGIATEIGKAQLAFGFEQLNCRRLLGLVDPRNGPSMHALQKLGLRYVKDVTERGRANRSVFCIEANEWRSGAREQRE